MLTKHQGCECVPCVASCLELRGRPPPKAKLEASSCEGDARIEAKPVRHRVWFQITWPEVDRVLQCRAPFSSLQILSRVCKLEHGKLSRLCFLGGEEFVQSFRMGTQVKGEVPTGYHSHTPAHSSQFSATHCPVLAPFCFSIFLIWCWQGTNVFPLDPFWFSNQFCSDIPTRRVNSHRDVQMSLS